MARPRPPGKSVKRPIIPARHGTERTIPKVETTMTDVAATIVLAEDDAELRAVYAECLRRAGHVVLEASDGGEAVILVRAHAPDLLLLDIWMPVLNGLEVLERLNQTVEAMGLAIVVLTSATDADVLLEGFALGVEECWTKDLSLVELCDRARAVLDRAMEGPRGAPPAPAAAPPRLTERTGAGPGPEPIPERAAPVGRSIGS